VSLFQGISTTVPNLFPNEIRIIGGSNDFISGLLPSLGAADAAGNANPIDSNAGSNSSGGKKSNGNTNMNQSHGKKSNGKENNGSKITGSNGRNRSTGKSNGSGKAMERDPGEIVAREIQNAARENTPSALDSGDEAGDHEYEPGLHLFGKLDQFRRGFLRENMHEMYSIS
jgi:hypothetical protein